MQKMIIPILMIFSLLLLQCSMPVSVEENNTLSIGEKNAKLLQNKVSSIGDNLHAIHVYYGENLERIMPEFRIDGMYLIDKNGDGYYNLSEMVAMTVQVITYSEQTQVINVVL